MNLLYVKNDKLFFEFDLNFVLKNEFSRSEME